MPFFPNVPTLNEADNTRNFERLEHLIQAVAMIPAPTESLAAHQTYLVALRKALKGE